MQWSQRHKGWRLSPAYDLNPTPIDLNARILSTSIDFDNPTASIYLALSVINHFRITTRRATEIIAQVAHAIRDWQIAATTLGLSKKEQERMASAFEHDEMKNVILA